MFQSTPCSLLHISMSGPKKPLFQPPVARGKPGWLQAFAKDLVKEDAGQLELQVGGKLEQ